MCDRIGIFLSFDPLFFPHFLYHPLTFILFPSKGIFEESKRASDYENIKVMAKWLVNITVRRHHFSYKWETM